MAEPKNARATRRALSRLLDAQGDRLYATFVRLTGRDEVAADLFQELFRRLGASQAFIDADDPAAYAFRTAINLAMDWRRKRKRQTSPAPPTDASEIISTVPSPLERMIETEQREQLLNALSELSESNQQLFVLRFIEQQPYAVIANQLNTTPHRARGLCHAALRELRRKLHVSNPQTDQVKSHV